LLSLPISLPPTTAAKVAGDIVSVALQMRLSRMHYALLVWIMVLNFL
jgi:hypothetical protein